MRIFHCPNPGCDFEIEEQKLINAATDNFIGSAGTKEAVDFFFNEAYVTEDNSVAIKFFAKHSEHPAEHLALKKAKPAEVMEDAIASRMDQEKTILVNGREKKVQWDFIAYRGAVELAFPDARDDQPGYDRLFTVTWSLKSGNIGGVLTPSEHTKVVEGMRFDVVDTSQA